MHIPDGRKYLITGGGGDNYDSLEIDLGDPEPPEWSPQNKDIVSIKDGTPQIKSGIKRLSDKSLTDLAIPQNSLPPLRTELTVRTKDRPYYDYYDELAAQRKAGLIPVRYMVYSEKETSNLKVTLTLPKNLGFVKSKEDKEDYPVSTLEDGRKQVLLYSGSMRLKQTKAFYFKLGALSREEELPLLATVESTTLEGEKLIKEDKLLIDLRSGFVY